MNTRRITALLTVAASIIPLLLPVAADAQAQAAPKTASAKTSPVAPRKEQIQAIVQEAYNKFKGDTRGKNADYIPALAQVNPKLFGIAVVSSDNQVITVGDVKSTFSNAGAIATVSLVSAKSADEKWQKILNFYSKAAGEKLTIMDDVYKSEAATNTGNKALSYLLAKYERIYADPFESVDVYTKQCSVGVNALQLARMGATLANDGVNPATGERVIKSENIPEILSTMMMAGLYDGSGGWSWHVGLPAKSGVGGGIVAVAPGKGAIAVFSPPLDEAGNSVKAQEVIQYVARQLDLNIYSPASVGLK